MAHRILLVEDDPSIRELTTIGLHAAGYEVVAAADGREGLDRFAADKPDAVVLDIMLPVLDGLVARLRVVLRRAGTTETGGPLRLGPLEIDEASHTVRRDDHEISLSHTEFRLLAELARRPGQVFTRELLLEQIWGYDYLGDSRLVDVAIQRLRAKVESEPAHPELILTVRGVGYKAHK
jgi:two-component system response regulator MtrA